MNILKKYAKYKLLMNEKKEIFKFLENANNIQLTNPSPSRINSVVMILPDIYPNLGGITSALRILTSLQKHGCQVTIAIDSDMDIGLAKKKRKSMHARI